MDWNSLEAAITRVPTDKTPHAIYTGGALENWSVEIVRPGYKSAEDFYVRVRRPDGTYASFDHVSLLVDIYARNEVSPAEARQLYQAMRAVVVDGADPLTLHGDLKGVEVSALRIPALILLCALQAVALQEQINYPKKMGKLMPLHFMKGLLANIPISYVLRNAVRGYPISRKYLRDNFGMSDDDARHALEP